MHDSGLFTLHLIYENSVDVQTMFNTPCYLDTHEKEDFSRYSETSFLHNEQSGIAQLDILAACAFSMRGQLGKRTNSSNMFCATWRTQTSSQSAHCRKQVSSASTL
jgi:hypothetical protein